MAIEQEMSEGLSEEEIRDRLKRLNDLIAARQRRRAAFLERDLEMERLKALLRRAAEVLEEEFGSPQDPEYGVRGPVHELIAELRKAVE